MAGRNNDVTVTTISGGDVTPASSVTIVDVPLTLPPAYDTLLPLYDDKDLPKYSEVVAVEQGSEQLAEVSGENPPSYENEVATSTITTLHSDNTPTTRAT